MRVALTSVLAAVAVLPACARHSDTHSTAPTSPTTTAVTSTAAAPLPAAPRTVTWVDLDVGQCITDLPQVEVGVVTVTIVDCATPHKAEVFLRAPLEVNAAVPGVADGQCAAAFPGYTGRPIQGSRYSVTYLVDSQQDRTEKTNLAPSTVICLVTDTDGKPLTGSVRH